MRLWIMIISLTAFLGAFPNPNVALHLPELPDDRVNVRNTRTKRGISFSIGLGKKKPEPKVQIVIMKPNFLTDLVMLKKGLLQKVIMTVVGLVGKLAGAKQMAPATKTMSMPMTEKETGPQTSAAAPQVSGGGSGKQMSGSTTTASGDTSGRQMGSGSLTINVQTSGNPSTSGRQVGLPSISGPMTVNVQSASNTMPATGSQAALLAAAEQLGQGHTGNVLRNVASALASTTSNGLIRRPDRTNYQGYQQTNAYIPQQTNTYNPQNNYNSQQTNAYIPQLGSAYSPQQANAYTPQQMNPLFANVYNPQQHSAVPIRVGGSWAVASHTPNGQMMMIMPSGSSAHDPVAQAVLTMMLNHRESNKPRIISNRPGFPSDFPVQTSAPPVLAFAVTPTQNRYTPVFNTSWSFPSPRSIQDNTIETESSTPSNTPSSTLAAILEIASRLFTTTTITPEPESESTSSSTESTSTTNTTISTSSTTTSKPSTTSASSSTKSTPEVEIQSVSRNNTSSNKDP